MPERMTSVIVSFVSVCKTRAAKNVKNTGVSFRNTQVRILTLSLCYCLVTKACLTLLRPHGLLPTRLLCPRDFSGKNAGVGCHFLPQGIFLTQISKPSP